MAWREDSDLFFSLLERSYQVVRAPAAVVEHPVRPGHWGISLKLQRKSMFNALLYRKHAGLYRQRVQPRPPWLYYGIAASLLTTFVAAAFRQPAVAGAAGSLWLFLTARFCAQRNAANVTPAGPYPGNDCHVVISAVAVGLLAPARRLTLSRLIPLTDDLPLAKKGMSERLCQPTNHRRTMSRSSLSANAICVAKCARFNFAKTDLRTDRPPL